MRLPACQHVPAPACARMARHAFCCIFIRFAADMGDVLLNQRFTDSLASVIWLWDVMSSQTSSTSHSSSYSDVRVLAGLVEWVLVSGRTQMCGDGVYAQPRFAS